MYKFIVLALLVQAFVCNATLLARLREFSQTYDFSHVPSGDYYVFWSVRGATLDVGVIGRVTGYVAFGLNPTAGNVLNNAIMDGSTAVIGNLVSNTPLTHD